MRKRCFCITWPLCSLLMYKLSRYVPNQNLCCGKFLSPNGKGIGGLHHVWKLLELWVIEWNFSRSICHVLVGHGLLWISLVAPKQWFRMIEPVVFDPSIEEIIWVIEKSTSSGHFSMTFHQRLLLTQLEFGCSVSPLQISNRVAGRKSIPSIQVEYVHHFSSQVLNVWQMFPCKFAMIERFL